MGGVRRMSSYCFDCVLISTGFASSFSFVFLDFHGFHGSHKCSFVSFVPLIVFIFLEFHWFSCIFIASICPYLPVTRKNRLWLEPGPFSRERDLNGLRFLMAETHGTAATDVSLERTHTHTHSHMGGGGGPPSPRPNAGHCSPRRFMADM